VSKLIHNPVYVGEARSGEHRKRRRAYRRIVSRAVVACSPGGTCAFHDPTPAGTATVTGRSSPGLLRCAGCRFVMKADKMTDYRGRRIRTYGAAVNTPLADATRGRAISAV